jgi:predicted neutral ceramidase superfamily lipid hydrolase
MANTQKDLPVNGTTAITAAAFEIADQLAIIMDDKKSQSDDSKSAMGKRMDNENRVFNLLVNAGNVSEVWSEVFNTMGFTHDVR